LFIERGGDVSPPKLLGWERWMEVRMVSGRREENCTEERVVGTKTGGKMEKKKTWGLSVGMSKGTC